MKTLTKNETEHVAGGLPFIALPTVITAIPVRPTPKPANEPVPANVGAEQ
ncbi:hypothetical protein [uncultured Erythrobacter sp.]|nr:hypothetical protein [uncultured Erythrobacter sp.]